MTVLIRAMMTQLCYAVWFVDTANPYFCYCCCLISSFHHPPYRVQFADIFIYSALAWYFWQVWPSKVGVPKPWYFVVDYNYWFPAESSRLRSRPHYDQQRDVEEPSDVEGNTDRTGGPIENSTIPVEVVNEKLLGSPTVEVSKLRKTFGSQVSVNDLSFKMYENQIFALLGHNGAGKV